LSAHVFGDPGSPSDVAGELSVDAHNTVDMDAARYVDPATQAAQMVQSGARTIKIKCSDLAAGAVLSESPASPTSLSAGASLQPK